MSQENVEIVRRFFEVTVVALVGQGRDSGQ
jgi:hypothetical protein